MLLTLGHLLNNYEFSKSMKHPIVHMKESCGIAVSQKTVSRAKFIGSKWKWNYFNKFILDDIKTNIVENLYKGQIYIKKSKANFRLTLSFVFRRFKQIKCSCFLSFKFFPCFPYFPWFSCFPYHLYRMSDWLQQLPEAT